MINQQLNQPEFSPELTNNQPEQPLPLGDNEATAVNESASLALKKSPSQIQDSNRDPLANTLSIPSYDLDTESLIDLVEDKATKNTLKNLTIKPSDNTEKIFLDKEGNTVFEEDSFTDADAIKVANTTFPDPPTEEAKEARVQELKQKREEEVTALEEQADQLIENGQLKERRRDKWISKRTKEIDDRYKADFKSGMKQIDSAYGNKSKTEKDVNTFISETKESYNDQLQYLQSLMTGSNLSITDIKRRPPVDEEYAKNYLSLKKAGIDTFEKFEKAYEEDRIPEGSVFMRSETFGLFHDTDSKRRIDRTKDVFLMATKDANGNKSIQKVADAVVNPITGVIEGAEIQDGKEITEIIADSRYHYFTQKDNVLNSIDQDLASKKITEQQANERKERANNIFSKTETEINQSYTDLLSNPNISNSVKSFVILSTHPSQFKAKFDEAVNNGYIKASDKEDIGIFGRYMTSAISNTGKALEKGADWVTSVNESLLGKEPTTLKKGVLALELKKNPTLAFFIDDVIKGLGSEAPKYLTNTEGISSIVETAKANQNNTDIQFITEEGKKLLKTSEAQFKQISEDKKKFEVFVGNATLDVQKILKESGYTSAFKDYEIKLADIANSKSKEIRDTYRFIKLQSEGLAEGVDPKEFYNTLSEDDKNFINTFGKEVMVKNTGLYNNVVGKINEVNELGRKANSLFPKQKLDAYLQENQPMMEEMLASINEKIELINSTGIMSPEGKSTLARLENIKDMMDAKSNEVSSYFFPTTDRDDMLVKNALLYTNPGIAGLSGVLNSVSTMMSGMSETLNRFSGFQWDNFDANNRLLEANLSEYERSIRNDIGDTKGRLTDVSYLLGNTLPQMFAFGKAVQLMGNFGSASFLLSTQMGKSMRDAVQAGITTPQGQTVYAVLTSAVEALSEKITPEADLFARKGIKGTLTKELVQAIMKPKTRKQALKEFAGKLWERAKKTGIQGSKEWFEEEVVDKSNYALQTFYNTMLNASFNPTLFTAKESTDTLLAMVGSQLIFKGAGKAQETLFKTPGEQIQIQKEYMRAGMSEVDATIMAGLSSTTGQKYVLDILKKVATGEIAETQINPDVLFKIEQVYLPAAMGFNIPQDKTLQQRVAYMDNIIKAAQVKEDFDNGQISQQTAEGLAKSFNDNAKRALEDPEFAIQQVGIDNSGYAKMITDMFGMSDIMRTASGAYDAALGPDGPVPQMPDMQPLNATQLQTVLSEIITDSAPNDKSAQKTIADMAKSPEAFLVREIDNTKRMLDIARLNYESASNMGAAPAEKARFDELSDRLNNLENLKIRYNQTQQYATQIIEGAQQSGAQRGGLVQYPRTQEGQPQIGQAEGGIRQAEEQTADYRNRNFGSQAKTAGQEIIGMMREAGTGNLIAEAFSEGNEVALMDSMSNRVSNDEAGMVRNFGQPVVDRIKQYSRQTGFIPTPIVAAPLTAAEQQAEDELSAVSDRAISDFNNAFNQRQAANKNSIKTLVDRLKKAFPNVNVVMDKKGFNAAMQDAEAKELMTKGGVIYGRVKDGTVYLNPDFANYNTPIHEFGHLWLNAAKVIAPDVYNRGLDLIRDSEYLAKIIADPLYQNLNQEELENEALAMAIGDRGEQFVNESQKQGFRKWMERMLRKLAQFSGIFGLSNAQLNALDLDTYLNMANASIFEGEAITKENIMSKRSQFQATAWHGSPYAFERFTTEKIGTGEGAQAFGWGLYFTDLKDIAKDYANKLSGFKLEIDGIEVKDIPNTGKRIGIIDNNGKQRTGSELKNEIIDALNNNIVNIKDAISIEEQKSQPNVNYINNLKNSINEEQSKIDYYKDKDFKITKSKGVTYKVSLHKGKSPSEYTWLEWDKPVSKDILEKLPIQERRRVLGFNDERVSKKVTEYIKEVGFKNKQAVKVDEIESFYKQLGYEGDRLKRMVDNRIKSNKKYFAFVLEESEVTPSESFDNLSDANDYLSSYAISKNEYLLTKNYSEKYSDIVSKVKSDDLKGELLNNKITGEELYKRVIERLTESDYDRDLEGLSKQGEVSSKNASLFLLENGIDGIKYPAESISRGATSDTARGFNYVVFDENAVTIEERTQFMARPKQGDIPTDSFGQWIDASIKRLISGFTGQINEAKLKEEVAASILAKMNFPTFIEANNKFPNFEKAFNQLFNESFINAKEALDSQTRQARLSPIYASPQARAVVDAAASAAKKFGKVKSKQGTLAIFNSVLDSVKASISSLYDGGNAPSDVSELEMLSLAPAIANDAIAAEGYEVLKDMEDTVVMNTAQLLRASLFNDIKDAELNVRKDAILKSLQNLYKKFSEKYGKGLTFTQTETKAIAAEVAKQVFNKLDVMKAADVAARNISSIVEEAFRKKLLKDTDRLIQALKARGEKGEFADADMRNKIIMNLANINAQDWVKSDAKLEDVAKFNHYVKSITGGRAAGRMDAINQAINIANNVRVTNSGRQVGEFNSLIDKIDRLGKKADAGALNLSDYASLQGLRNNMENLAQKKAEIEGLTDKQKEKLKKKFAELTAKMPSNIDEMIEAAGAMVRKDLDDKIVDIKKKLETVESDLRFKIKNPLHYKQFMKMVSLLIDKEGKLNTKYLNALSVKELLSLSNVLDDITINGNYNNAAYNQFIKIQATALKIDGKNWSINISKRRNKLMGTGLLNNIASRIKKFKSVFVDVEGGARSADLIAENLPLLSLQSLDVELFNGFDEFGMGFLERDIFAPMSAAIDSASIRAMAGLENLKQSMILLNDKSNHALIKKGIGKLSTEYNGFNISTFTKMKSLMRGKFGGGVYNDISVRMATIIAHQIDHISNLKEGQEATDMVLQRNILESKDSKKTMREAFKTASDFESISADYDRFVNAIAYAILTESGTKKLTDYKTEDDLKKLLAPSQVKALSEWRNHIEGNRDLVEATMTIRGNMKSLYKNYFPRRVFNQDVVKAIDDADAYVNGQVEPTGLSEAQFQERTGDVGRLDLDGNRVLYNNLKALHLLYEVKPYLETIKGIGNAIDEMKVENDMIERVYLEGVKKHIDERLKALLLRNEKAGNDSFSGWYRAVSASASFAAKTWLIAETRQIPDFVANTIKTYAALANAQKTLKVQMSSVISPKKYNFTTEKGTFTWDDYVDVVNVTGSPVFKVMSIYADDFLYDYSKSPEQLQREQRVAAWQDMAQKKHLWAERFENVFKKITGEAFDHEAFKDERGLYRAMYGTVVQKASDVADSFVDSQYGLPSMSRKNLQVAPLIPIIGRGLRNAFKSQRYNKVTKLAADGNGAMVTSFLQGFPSKQNALFVNNIKMALSETTGLSVGQRLNYLFRAFTETVLPTMFYTVARTFISIPFQATAAIIYAAAGNEKEQEALFKKAESEDFWGRLMLRLQYGMRNRLEEVFDVLANSTLSVGVDPQTSWFTRASVGLFLFKKYTENMTEELNNPKYTSKQRKEIKRKIREKEDAYFNIYNIKALEWFNTEDYNTAVKFHMTSSDVSADQRELLGLIAGFQAVYDTGRDFMKTIELIDAADKNPKLSKEQLYYSIVMQGYGILLSNFIFSGKMGMVASMFSGDINKVGKMILKDQSAIQKQSDFKESPFMVVQKKKGGGSAKNTGRSRGAIKNKPNKRNKSTRNR